jgi:hypothetical protein
LHNISTRSVTEAPGIVLPRKLKAKGVGPDFAILIVGKETSQDSAVAEIAVEGEETTCCGGSKRVSNVDYLLGLVTGK